MSEAHWLSDTVWVQQIKRVGMSDLFIGGVNGKAKSFYDVNDLAMWLLDNGVSDEDPVWDYLEQLETSEVN